MIPCAFSHNFLLPYLCFWVNNLLHIASIFHSWCHLPRKSFISLSHHFASIHLLIVYDGILILSLISFILVSDTTHFLIKVFPDTLLWFIWKGPSELRSSKFSFHLFLQYLWYVFRSLKLHKYLNSILFGPNEVHLDTDNSNTFTNSKCVSSHICIERNACSNPD